MIKKVAYLTVILVLFLSACQSNNLPASNPVIFFTFKGRDNWEIWKMQEGGESAEAIYQLQRKVDLSSTMQKIVEPQIVNKLRDKPFSMKGNEILETDIGSIVLSPNHKMLSWHEMAYWCPGNYCYGQSAIRILNLENNAIITSYVTTDFVGIPSWSPDSQFIIFDQTTSSKGDIHWHQPIIYLFNVTTAETIQLAYGYEPAFARDEDRVFAYTLSDSNSLSCCQAIHPSSGTIENLSWVTDDFAKFAISPNGNNLLVVNYEDNLGHPNIIDLRTQHIEQLTTSFDTAIREIKWSPNGKHFAILLFDPFNLKVFNNLGKMQFSVEDVWSWEWAENSKNIILIKRSNSGCNAIDPYIYVITISTGEISKLEFPSQIERILNNKNKMDCQNNLFGEITW